jgi:hypothetical protein
MTFTSTQRHEFDRMLSARMARSPRTKDPDETRAALEAEIQSLKWRVYPRPHWCTTEPETCGVCYCPNPENPVCRHECGLC